MASVHDASIACKDHLLMVNVVDPEARIDSLDAPFSVLGNRGGRIHERGVINRSQQSRRWIYCPTGALRTPDELMRDDHYTELFFLDEATALAAGHRPCYFCNRARYDEYASAWHGAGGADDLDRDLAADRRSPGGAKRTYDDEASRLPAGAIVRVHDRPYLLRGPVAYPWTPFGYGPPVSSPRGLVTVLTPRTSVQVLVGGFTLNLSSPILRWT